MNGALEPVLPSADAAVDDASEETPLRRLLAGLERARKLTLWTLAALAAGTVLGWSRAPWIFEMLARPVTDALVARGEDPRLGYTSLTDPFILYFTISLACGILVALPALATQLWLVVAPRLRRRSVLAGTTFVIAACGLFVGGVAFCYGVLLPVAVEYLIGVGGEFESALTVREFLRFTIRLMLALGIAAELPLLSFVTARAGLVDARTLLRWLPYATVASFIVGAWLSPPDVLSQTLVALPMLGLYLVGVGLAALAGRNKATRRT